MRTVGRNQKVGEREVDNLKLHHQMYERRVRLLKECDGQTDSDVTDGATDPAPLDVEDSGAKRD